MCGFVAFISMGNTLSVSKAESALQTIKHRGPDATGFITDHKSYFFGHNRLSIIDVSKNANQPFLSGDGKYSIVFNGEIYNYKELKADLNLPFRTNSDTEVILEGFIKEGEAFFSKLRGMYAFVIAELDSPKIWVVRDPVGIKPLYYAHIGDTVSIASEIKAILHYLDKKPEINHQALSSYINTGYISEPLTVYKGIEAVEPGFVYRFDGKNWSKWPFFSFNFDPGNEDIKLEEIEHALEMAVKRNLVADIECAVALSSGIDSSLIYFLSHKLNPEIQSLSVAMADSNYDETDGSRKYAEFCKGKFQKLVIDNDFNLDLVNDLLAHFDQPFADSSMIPMYFLTEATREHTKVLLAGDGGDEVFNGYPFMHYVSVLAGNPFFKGVLGVGRGLSPLLPYETARLINRLSGVAGKPVYEAIYNINAWFPSNLEFNGRSIFVQDKYAGLQLDQELAKSSLPDTRDGKIIYHSFRKILLSDYLRKTDMMAMKNGIELRVPFLDEDLVQLAFRMSFNEKSSYRKGKLPLRKIHEKYYEGLGANQGKKGFSIPLDVYFKEEEKQRILKVILDKNAVSRNYIHSDYIEFLGEQFMSFSKPQMISRGSIYQRVFLLYSLERWYADYTK